ncbi:MAG: nicotinate-nucleotide adenylyltransferase [Burkholderiales bacterium]|nr:nicotinate-nucleotide adenylyltransferase [Burkholderiales bacterium]
MDEAAHPTGRDPLVLLGGTFDPVHAGHLGLADDVRSALGVSEVRLVPARDPPHRPPPGATAVHRLAMLRLAIEGRRGLTLDDREMRRRGRSYTVDTLKELRDRDRGRSIVLVLGADAFRGLPTWYRWSEILELAHIAVAARPGDPFDSALPEPLVALWENRRTSDPRDLVAARAGRICIVSITPHDVSASAIRAAIARGGPEREAVRPLLAPAVWDYIAAHRLYAA